MPTEHWGFLGGARYILWYIHRYSGYSFKEHHFQAPPPGLGWNARTVKVREIHKVIFWLHLVLTHTERWRLMHFDILWYGAKALAYTVESAEYSRYMQTRGSHALGFRTFWDSQLVKGVYMCRRRQIARLNRKKTLWFVVWGRPFGGLCQ